MRYLFLVVILSSFYSQTMAQGMWFGPRTGFDLNFQQWNGAERNTIITPHFDFLIESYTEDDPSSLYAFLGYHTRGSSIRFNFFNGASGFDYRFNNIVLGVGAKRFIQDKAKFRPYYILGIRGEYTIGTNLDQYTESPLAAFHPNDQFVNKINYGVTLGMGFDYPLGELYSGMIEFAIHPDVSKQYEQPALANVVVPQTPFSTSGTSNIPQRDIRNLSFEVTIGIRFLRKVEYY